MNAYAYSNQRERFISGAGAFGMHLLFIALLVFGVNWQKKVEPQTNIVDLWTNLPSQPQPKIDPPPPPQPVMPPKVEPAPPPKAVAKSEVAKPDIALKEKAEKERRMLEQKQAEAKKQAEVKKRQEEANLAALKQQQAKEADAQRLAKEHEDVKRKLAEQAAAARVAQLDKYKAAIRDRIKRFIVLPPNLQGNPEAEFDVSQLPGGEVLDVKLKRASGNSAYDDAVERAIRRAQPLPLPPDPSLFQRELNLTFRAQEK